MRGRVIVLAIAGTVLIVPQLALAHPTRSFDSCAAYRRHGRPCLDSATYDVGDRVFLRGRVDPPHANHRAYVNYLRPGAVKWRRGVSVPISESGRMRWSFRSESGDASADAWHFRFRIVGHGKSDVTEVFIRRAGHR
jgi:hypothetical protein